MKKLSLIVSLALVAVACISDPTVESQVESTPVSKIVNANVEPAPGFLMVRLSEDASVEAFGEMTDVAIDAKLLYPRSKTRAKSKIDDWYLLSFDKSVDVKALASCIAKDERVERVEYDVYIQRATYKRLDMPLNRPEPTRSMDLPFDDPELPWQWHYYNDASLDPELCVEGADINLLNAWKYTAGDNRVIVAVCDGGVMATHPDLKDNMWVNEAEKSGTKGVDDDGNGYVDDVYGYNFVAGNGNVTADSHGTHVAGTISAVNNNGFATCGIAGGTGNGDGVRIMSLQIFEGEDGCYQHQLAQAFRYAADNGAVIINNSWGYMPEDDYANDREFERYDSTLKSAIEYFETNAKLDGVIDGGLVVFAAGNEEYPSGIYPGAYHRYICVSAMSSDFKAAYYTNYGPGVNICAPGGDVYYGTIFTISSTSVEYAYSYGYEYMQGTSMATPHVSGCAALAVSYAAQTGKRLTADELRMLIVTSVHDIDQYQVGTKSMFDYYTGTYYDIELNKFQGKLGTGYIDAHLLLMQMDSTPCLYLRTGEQSLLSLDAYFGTASQRLTYKDVEVSSSVMDELGITTTPTIENGQLKVACTKPGVGRIKVKAIAGGSVEGGNYNMGGMPIEREFELVVRGAVATNGGWL
ncbi:MAG: S8 family serine peptidase [Alistipes sp.]|nr:S8 family serine peptidase [Alistipes sp.]